MCWMTWFFKIPTKLNSFGALPWEVIYNPSYCQGRIPTSHMKPIVTSLHTCALTAIPWKVIKSILKTLHPTFANPLWNLANISSKLGNSFSKLGNSFSKLGNSFSKKHKPSNKEANPAPNVLKWNSQVNASHSPNWIQGPNRKKSPKTTFCFVFSRCCRESNSDIIDRYAACKTSRSRTLGPLGLAMPIVHGPAGELPLVGYTMMLGSFSLVVNYTS